MAKLYEGANSDKPDPQVERRRAARYQERPERCRRSVKEPKACRFRSSSMDIAHAGFRNTERDWHRLPANRGRMLPSRARNLAYLPLGEAIMAAATSHLIDYCGRR